MEKESLNIPIENFVRKEWNEMKVYKITAQQQEELLNNYSLNKKFLVFPAHQHFPIHSHDRPQLILVIDGELTHVAKTKEYPQEKYELLVVPAYLQHTAFAGKDTLKIYMLTKKFPETSN
jgi:quercetin dioxygenase-like cupin family protein